MRRSLRTGLCLGIVGLATTTVLAIGTIKELTLEEGRDDVNTLKAPVVDGATTAIAIGTIAGTFDKGAKIVRKGATGFMTRGPEYNLDKALDLPALFASALKAEATAMGFTSGAGGWSVDGTIKDVYVESKQIPYGATLFWGYMDVDFRVADTDAIVGRAVGLGAALLHAPHDVPGFRTAELADPQGAAFTVTQFLFE